jgi:hypothetical protein
MGAALGLFVYLGATGRAGQCLGLGFLELGELVLPTLFTFVVGHPVYSIEREAVRGSP